MNTIDRTRHEQGPEGTWHLDHQDRRHQAGEDGAMPVDGRLQSAIAFVSAIFLRLFLRSRLSADHREEVTVPVLVQ